MLARMGTESDRCVSQGAAVQLAGRARGAAERARRDARVTRFGVTVLAAITLTVAAGGAATALTLHGTRVPAAGAARLPVAYDGVTWWDHGQVRPHIIYLGGSAVFLRVPHWARWATMSATGHATLWVDNCRPSCAAGHYRTYPATVRLGRAADHHGVRYFSRMRLRYAHGSSRDYAFRWGTYRGATVPVWIGGPGG